MNNDYDICCSASYILTSLHWHLTFQNSCKMNPWDSSICLDSNSLMSGFGCSARGRDCHLQASMCSVVEGDA